MLTFNQIGRSSGRAECGALKYLLPVLALLWSVAIAGEKPQVLVWYAGLPDSTFAPEVNSFVAQAHRQWIREYLEESRPKISWTWSDSACSTLHLPIMKVSSLWSSDTEDTADATLVARELSRQAASCGWKGRLLIAGVVPRDPEVRGSAVSWDGAKEQVASSDAVSALMIDRSVEHEPIDVHSKYAPDASLAFRELYQMLRREPSHGTVMAVSLAAALVSEQGEIIWCSTGGIGALEDLDIINIDYFRAALMVLSGQAPLDTLLFLGVDPASFAWLNELEQTLGWPVLDAMITSLGSTDFATFVQQREEWRNLIHLFITGFQEAFQALDQMGCFGTSTDSIGMELRKSLRWLSEEGALRPDCSSQDAKLAAVRLKRVIQTAIVGIGDWCRGNMVIRKPREPLTVLRDRIRFKDALKHCFSSFRLNRAPDAYE